MKISAPIFQLKRQAKALSREEKIPLHAALDRIAMQQGYRGWSLLAHSAAPAGPAEDLFARLTPGDMVLLGARPRQGKTLMGLKLAVAAMKGGSRSAFLTLEYTHNEMLDRFRAIGVDARDFGGLFDFDNADIISSDYIVAKLSGARRGTLAVIDYLQLLDQKRENPDLMIQIRQLKAFAQERGVIFVLISQIDRSYDPVIKSCPDVTDVRLPNPLDLGLFSKTCFLNGDEVRLSATI